MLDRSSPDVTSWTYTVDPNVDPTLHRTLAQELALMATYCPRTAKWTTVTENAKKLLNALRYGENSLKPV